MYEILDNTSITGNENRTQAHARLNPIFNVFISSVIFLLSISGNSMAIWVLLKHGEVRRKATNALLVNLAVSDLCLAVFCVPFTVIPTTLEDFMFGMAACIAVRYLQAVSVAVNCFTLIAISLERYYAICKPFQSRRWQTLTHSYRVIVITWIGALVVMVPVAACHRLVTLKNGNRACREIWASHTLGLIYTFALDVIILVLPITVMSVAYILIARKLWSGDTDLRNNKTLPSSMVNSACSEAISENEEAERNSRRDTPIDHSPYHMRISNYEKNLANKRKVVKMLLVVVLEYFICWAPLFIINTWISVDYVHARQRITPMTKSLLHLLSYISSCCNPITYCFMNRKFRQGFLTAFRCGNGNDTNIAMHITNNVRELPTSKTYCLSTRIQRNLET